MRVPLAVVAALGLALAAAGEARAAGCQVRTDGTLVVDKTSSGFQRLTLSRSSGQWTLAGVPCSGDPSTPVRSALITLTPGASSPGVAFDLASFQSGGTVIPVDGHTADSAVVGTPGDDVLTVQHLDGADVVLTNGSPWIRGGARFTLLGGAGNDTLLGGARADNVPDPLDARTQVQVAGQEGDDTVRGGAFPNPQWGNAVYDQVSGGPGNDRIHGSPGRDNIEAGDGTDLVRAGAQPEFDVIVGGPGDDVLTYVNHTRSVIVHNWPVLPRLQCSCPSNGAPIMPPAPPWQPEDLTVEFEVVGGSANSDELWGASGDEALQGAGGNDVIHAAQGNDQVSGGAGTDTIFGEAGNDLLSGNDGDDRIDGGDGTDTLDGGAGTNGCWQGPGDTLRSCTPLPSPIAAAPAAPPRFKVTLSGRGEQRLGERRRIRVTLRSTTTSTVALTARLEPRGGGKAVKTEVLGFLEGGKRDRITIVLPRRVRGTAIVRATGYVDGRTAKATPLRIAVRR